MRSSVSPQLKKTEAAHEGTGESWPGLYTVYTCSLCSVSSSENAPERSLFCWPSSRFLILFCFCIRTRAHKLLFSQRFVKTFVSVFFFFPLWKTKSFSSSSRYSSFGESTLMWKRFWECLQRGVAGVILNLSKTVDKIASARWLQRYSTFFV